MTLNKKRDIHMIHVSQLNLECLITN